MQFLLARTINAQEADPQEEIQNMVDEWTQSIEIDRKMITKGWKDESSLALDFLNRGKVYWAYANDYQLADQDFTTALLYFDGQEPREHGDWVFQLRYVEAWHYRAICRQELGDFVAAEKDANLAVDGFAELVKGGHGASMQVYALKIRAEIRTHQNASVSSLRSAIADYELASSVSKEIATTNPEMADFFEEQIAEFRKQKALVEERVIASDSASNSDTYLRKQTN